MTDLLMITVAGAGVAYVISRISIYIHLRIFRSSDDDYVMVDVYLPHGMHLYTMKVPVIDLVIRNHFPWLESEIETKKGETRTHSLREQRFIKNLFNIYVKHPRKLNRLFRVYRYYQQMYCRFMHRVIKTICCEKFYWRTTLGSEDAAMTAMLSGMLWSVKAMILTFLQKRTNFTAKPVIKVQPSFEKQGFEMDFQCIFSIKLGNLINALKSAVYSKSKGVRSHV